jgi:5-methylcytosine-specific restriction endonuclease McrA
MARELVEKNGIGESTDAVWKQLNGEHQRLFPTKMEPAPSGSASELESNIKLESPLPSDGLIESALHSGSVLNFGQKPEELRSIRRRPRSSVPAQGQLFQLNWHRQKRNPTQPLLCVNPPVPKHGLQNVFNETNRKGFVMKLRSQEYCPIHKSRFCCGRTQGRKERESWIAVLRIEDPHHPRGYRERRSCAEMKRLLARKVVEQEMKCGICGEMFTDYREIVPDHIIPKGMGSASRDDHPDNIQAALRRCNLKKGSGRVPGSFKNNSSESASQKCNDC